MYIYIYIRTLTLLFPKVFSHSLLCYQVSRYDTNNFTQLNGLIIRNRFK